MGQLEWLNSQSSFSDEENDFFTQYKIYTSSEEEINNYGVSYLLDKSKLQRYYDVWVRSLNKSNKSLKKDIQTTINENKIAYPSLKFNDIKFLTYLLAYFSFIKTREWFKFCSYPTEFDLNGVKLIITQKSFFHIFFQHQVHEKFAGFESKKKRKSKYSNILAQLGYVNDDVFISIKLLWDIMSIYKTTNNSKIKNKLFMLNCKYKNVEFFISFDKVSTNTWKLNTFYWIDDTNSLKEGNSDYHSKKINDDFITFRKN